MKKFLKGIFVYLSFLLTIGLITQSQNLVLAQTADGETPAVEDVCDGLSGRAYGLCNAYCEAMDCESADPQASDEACDKVLGNLMALTGEEPPCAIDPTPCGQRASCGGSCINSRGNVGICVSATGNCICFGEI